MKYIDVPNSFWLISYQSLVARNSWTFVSQTLICWIPWIVDFPLCILPSIPWPLDYFKVFPLSHEVWVNEVWLFLFLYRYFVVHWPCMQTTCCVLTFVEQHAMRASGSWGQRSVIDKNQVFISPYSFFSIYFLQIAIQCWVDLCSQQMIKYRLFDFQG